MTPALQREIVPVEDPGFVAACVDPLCGMRILFARVEQSKLSSNWGVEVYIRTRGASAAYPVVIRYMFARDEITARAQALDLLKYLQADRKSYMEGR